MNDFLAERESVWDRLLSAKLPIVIYGMGDGADKIIHELHVRNLEVSDIFASDEFVRGHSFRGHRVMRYSEVYEKYRKFIVLVAFGVHDTPTMERLYAMSRQVELYAPDVPVMGKGVFDILYYKKHEDEFCRTYQMLSDTQSRLVFENSINYKISGKIEYLKACETTPEEAYQHLICPSDHEIYVDLGAYDGDTIREFLGFTNGRAEKIIALEPDAKNFKKLIRCTQDVTCINAGAWCEDTVMHFAAKAGRNSAINKNGVETVMRSVDSVLGGTPATYLKFDVEGAEYDALLGARETIARYKPKLFVAAYHRNEDLFVLPELILKLNPDYKLYLRHYPYIPAWETNIIAI